MKAGLYVWTDWAVERFLTPKKLYRVRMCGCNDIECDMIMIISDYEMAVDVGTHRNKMFDEQDIWSWDRWIALHMRGK